ncbi:MAG: histidine phosphatase family protein [Sulfuricurvum sp.]|nr:histidine phosphatase family protein [Sulfuricurvum sp.]
MKTLYIIRHAKSDWDDLSLSDFERPLNKRGEKNALFMGELLTHNNVHPDLIVSSPAVRAKTTAKEIAKKVNYDTKKIVYAEGLYLADVDTIEGVLKKVSSSKKTVFIVGHNPGLTLFAEYISGYDIDNIPTCGIFCVKLKNDDWKSIGRGMAEFVSFDYPKKHRDS